MKKNLMLGVFALMLAASTAFVTAKTLTIQKVYFWDDEDDPQECLDQMIDISCPQTGGVCRYETNSGNRQLYTEDCQLTLKQNTGF